MDCAEDIVKQFGEDAKVITVIVVAEVLAQNKQGEYIDSIEFSSSERRRWVQMAMLNEAAARAEGYNELRVEKVEESLSEED